MTPDEVGQVGSLEVNVQGETVVLRGDRALFWPRMNWLIVADLHLGKTESLRRDGIALPDSVMEADLARLRLAVEATRATHLVVLGDLVHDAHGMTVGLVQRVAAWRETVAADISLVPGNHDRRVDVLPASWRLGMMERSVSFSPFVFSHEPQPGEGFNWHGHIHPVVRLNGRGDHLRLPCFVMSEVSGILPAFSALTAGAVQRLADGTRAWVIADGTVMPLTGR